MYDFIFFIYTVYYIYITAPILSKFKERVNGTTATLTAPFLRWVYFTAEPEFGRKQASQCIIELQAALARHDVKITNEVIGQIEILPYGVDKSILAKLLLNRLPRANIISGFGGHFPRFVLAIGDDHSDDKMFEVLLLVIFISFIIYSV